jgi:hypothetical protein
MSLLSSCENVDVAELAPDGAILRWSVGPPLPSARVDVAAVVVVP